MPTPVIPSRVLLRVQFYAGRLASFNRAVADARHTGIMFGQPGRYEAEYRARHEPEADATLASLAEVEALAATNGVSLDTLYAHVGGQPVKEPWSAEAQAWRHDEPVQAG